MFLQMCHEQSKCVVWGGGNTPLMDSFIAASESVMITYCDEGAGMGKGVEMEILTDSER